MKKYHTLNVKIGAFFLGLVVLIGVGMGSLIYHVNYSNSVETSKKQLVRCGNYVSNIIDADKIETWLKNGENDEYRTTKKDMVAFQSCYELSYMFVYRPCLDENKNFTGEVEFIFDFNPPQDTEDKERKLGEHVSDIREKEQITEVVKTGEPQSSHQIDGTLEGPLLAAFVPMKLSTGENYAIVGVSRSIEKVKQDAMQASVMMTVAVELVIVLFAAAILFYLYRKVIRPVKYLSGRMENFVSGGDKLSDKHVTEIRTHDELEQMADNFNKMTDSISKYTSDLKNITASEERLRAELDVAGSIRSAVSAELTYPAFTERSDFELYASMKNTVYNSCSFCNYFLTDEDHLTIIIGESVGKSLPAMLMSMLAATHISALAKMHVEPYSIAYGTNNSLCGFERNDMSMTVSAIIADIDLARGEMKYVNAGMPPIIVKRTGEPYQCETESMQFNLGEMHGVSFEQKTMKLNQGTALFFTSYGVPEMKNKYGEKLTNSRLSEEINTIAGRRYPLNEMVAELELKLEMFGSGVQSELDTTILGFRYLG